ncbi:MAG: prepilin peptidase [Myxococcales bacterium]|nr:prepilin peptidase [Myxococcales bacterium]
MAVTEVPVQPALWTVLGLALVISAATDIYRQRILDAVTYPAIALALLLRLSAEGLGDAQSGLISGLLAAGAGSGLFALFAAFGKGFGWGDVKLLGAVGAGLGFPAVLAALVFISVVGAAQAAATLLLLGGLGEAVRDWARRWSARLFGASGPSPSQRRIPYGVAIAIGSFWAMWWERSGT